MLPSLNRLKSPSEFYKLKKFGQKIHSKNFTFQFIKNTEHKKIAVVISKKISPKAHDRNRIKRITRALIKESLNYLPSNMDLVVYPKVSVSEIQYSLLLKEMISVFEKF